MTDQKRRAANLNLRLAVKRKRVMGGALPAPGSIAQMAGRVFSNPTVAQSGRAGQFGQASTAAARTFNTMLGPTTEPTTKGLRPGTAPKVPKPKDTSPKPVVSQYRHPAAKTAQPRTTASAAHTTKGRGRSGGAKPY